MAVVAWKTGTVLVATFQEATLANNEMDISSTITNSELMPLGDVRVDIDPGGTMTIGEVLANVYIIRTVDGTEEFAVENIAGGTGYAPPESYIGSCIALQTADPAAAQSYIIREVTLPPGNFKLAVKNVSGTEFDAVITADILP